MAAVVVAVMAAAACGSGDGRSDAESVGVVEVPPVGEVVLDQLDDGTPVWVVHHEDGEVSVLDPAVTVDGYPDGPPGLRFLARWWPADRRFAGGGAVFDERGTALGLPSPGDIAWTGEGTASDMGRYRTEDAGDHPLRGAPASRDWVR